MNKYELLYILSASLDDAAKDAAIQKISSIVTEAGGAIDKIDKWGVRKLAYPIKFKNEGYYVLMNFTGPAELPLEIARQIKISDDFLRHMLVRLD
ncbi:MAG: 30S ribosomal protein S6 [Clostridiales bacterium]|nr:30S ribosomal protein S6 [Clostridiales bacterium]